MRISVIGGGGVVGLVTGAVFAELGHKVLCEDLPCKISEINSCIKKKELPIYENGLDDLVFNNMKSGNLKFTDNLENAVKHAETILITVGTPENPETGEADLKYIYKVSENIAKVLNDYKLIVIKSTVPPMTTENAKHIIQQYTEQDFDIAMNPEFLQEGRAVDTAMRPDRIIIGVENKRAEQILRELYDPLVRNGHSIISMGLREAELSKYSSNFLLAARISLINEIARVCDAYDANVHQVREGAGSDKRIGKHFLYPGIGFGGSCFPKDVAAFLSFAEKTGVNPLMATAVLETNEHQKHLLPKMAKAHFKDLKNKKFCIWGLAFKKDTDDIRGSPALTVIEDLFSEGAIINAYDPKALENTKKYFGNKINYFNDCYEALENCDALMICTDWLEFRDPDLLKVKTLLKNPVIFDGKNQFSLEKIKTHNFYYSGIGCKHIPQ